MVAVIDWYSRQVLSWRLSNTLDSGFLCGLCRNRYCLQIWLAKNPEHSPQAPGNGAAIGGAALATPTQRSGIAFRINLKERL
jgi:hypothetical protein